MEFARGSHLSTVTAHGLWLSPHSVRRNVKSGLSSILPTLALQYICVIANRPCLLCSSGRLCPFHMRREVAPASSCRSLLGLARAVCKVHVKAHMKCLVVSTCPGSAAGERRVKSDVGGEQDFLRDGNCANDTLSTRSVFVRPHKGG